MRPLRHLHEQKDDEDESGRQRTSSEDPSSLEGSHHHLALHPSPVWEITTDLRGGWDGRLSPMSRLVIGH